MTDEKPKATIPSLPNYNTGMRVADAKEQKPLMKLMSKMLVSKTAKVMKMQMKSPKKKHKVTFY